MQVRRRSGCSGGPAPSPPSWALTQPAPLLQVEDLHVAVSEQLGLPRDRLRLVHAGQPLTEQAAVAKLRDGDSLLAIFAPRPPPQKLRDLADGGGEDDDEELIRWGGGGGGGGASARDISCVCLGEGRAGRAQYVREREGRVGRPRAFPHCSPATRAETNHWCTGPGAWPASSSSHPACPSPSPNRFRLAEGAPAWQRRGVALLRTRLGMPDWALTLLLGAGWRFWGGLLAWAAACKVASWYDLGPVFFLASIFALILLNLGRREEGALSGYSLFNPGGRRLAGQLTAEELDGQLRRGNL